MTTYLRGGRARLAAVVSLVLAGAVPAPAVAQTRGDLSALDATRAARAGAFAAATDRASRPVVDLTPATGARDVQGRLLVTLASSGDGARRLAAAPALRGAEVVRLADRVLSVAVAPGQEAASAKAIGALPDVIAVERPGVRQRLAVPDDPEYPGQWQYPLTDMESAWDVTTGSPEVVVAVIDDGINATHDDLAAQVVEQVDAATGTIVPQPVGIDNDPCGEGHATQVGGVIGAAGNNGVFVTGVNWEVSILDIRVFSEDVDCAAVTDDAVIAGIDYATNRPQGPVDVINLSLGGISEACSVAYQTVIDAARAAGVVVVSSSGNHQDDPAVSGLPSTPASCNGVISVAAVGATGETAYYSVANDYVDITGPGGDFEAGGLEGGLLSTSRDGRTAPTQGTSFSSPFVAGLAALVRSANPALTPDEVESVIERSALDSGDAGRDAVYGWGLVQGGAAVELALAPSVPAPEPDPDFPVGGSDGPVDLPPTDPIVIRLAAGNGVTDPIEQAVTVSQVTFPSEQSSDYAVLARADNYADALAGSALNFGLGPLLFTGSTGPLSPLTAAELQRVVVPGGVVYILGGNAALPATVEGDLQALGYQPVRIAGATREETAALVGEEVRALLPRLGFENLPIAMLATRENWPDAVAAGQMASYFGIPILLTPKDSLDPSAAAALSAWAPELLYVIGGPGAVSDAVREQAEVASGAGVVQRLSGPARDATTVSVSQEFEFVLNEVLQAPPEFAVAVNVRREPDGYAHVLSASMLSGNARGVFIPIEGQDGTLITETAAAYVNGFGVDGILAGDVDVLSDEVGAELEALLRGL